MKILLINHYAGSIYHGMEFRPYYMSKEWVKAGHEVVIVSASFSHLRQKNPDVHNDNQEEIIGGIRYIWLKTPGYKGNGVGRVRNMLCFIHKLYKYLPVITANFTPDAVIASSTYPLDSYPARWIAKKHNAKFVFELHDLWPMSPQVLGHMSKWHPFIMIMQMAEDYWCKNADVVISLLPDAYKHLVTRGMKMDKYHVVPNGVDVNEWSDSNAPLPNEHAACLRELKEQNKFLVGYLGGHGISNGLDTIIDLAAKVIDNPQIHFVLIGKGTEKGRLEKRTEGLHLKNVSFLPPVPKKAVPKILKKMDVLICVSPDTPLCQYGMSLNKIFDYMMSSKPILWASSSSNDIVAASYCGFTVSSGDVDGLKSQLLNIYVMNADELSELGRNGKTYILEHYTYSKLAQKFIDAINGEKWE